MGQRGWPFLVVDEVLSGPQTSDLASASLPLATQPFACQSSEVKKIHGQLFAPKTMCPRVSGRASEADRGRRSSLEYSCCLSFLFSKLVEGSRAPHLASPNSSDLAYPSFAGEIFDRVADYCRFVCEAYP